MSRLLDTSAVLAHHRQEPGWQRVQAIFEDKREKVLLAALSVTELARRLRALGAAPADVEATVSAYLEIVEVVPIDLAVARTAIQVAASARKRLPLADALIAACACSRGAYLVHRDAHMSAIPAEMVLQETL